MIKRQSLIKLSASITMVAVFAASFSGSLQASAQSSVYWGAYISGSTYGLNPATGLAYGNPPWDLNTWDLFEAHAGKKMSIFHWGSPWYASNAWPYGYFPFPTSLATAIRNRGAIPMLDWSSFDLSVGSGSLNQPRFALSTIINGTHDAYIRQWAADAKAWGYPMFLRFDWEMNGNWFPWSEQVNGNTPGQYVAAWRHVHDIFTAAGASNITWVWAPNIGSTGSTALAALYPGDAYVDWTGLDGYNKYSSWLAFNQVFAASGITWLYNSYQEVLSVAPSKPIMLAEFASLEAGDGGAKKAAWITDALSAQIPANFPAIKAILWFNWNADAGSSFVIESSAAAQAAFAAGIASSAYAANDFGSLPLGTKIQPLNAAQPTNTPASTQTSTAAPTQTSTAAPSQTSTAAPSRTSTAAPTQTSTAAPSRTSTAAPTQTSTAVPSRTSTAAPTARATQNHRKH
jgi:hypothetical protein